LPISLWQVGLASTPNLSGPWKRNSELNPLNIEKVFIENPIVTRLSDGTYIAVYDNRVDHAVGYTFSRDGIHWAPGRALIVQKAHGIWASEVRTPLGLIPEGNNSFTLFYTANQDQLGAPTDQHGIKMTPGALGLVQVKLEGAHQESCLISLRISSLFLGLRCSARPYMGPQNKEEEKYAAEANHG
jgi:hypothetical protein